MQTFKKVKVAILTGDVKKDRAKFKVITNGEDFDTEDEFREALHDCIEDELDCMIEELES